jgi:hypothetical protein
MLKEIWQDFPPWLKTFLIGLALAIAAPTLTALESIDTATDWRVWLGSLTAAVLLSVGHYLKDRLRITLAEALAGGGLLLAVMSVGVTYVAISGATQAGVTPPGVNTGDTVAFEPGSGFNVAAYCKTAKTVTIANVPGAEVIGTRRVARNSDLDYIEWLDNNSNTSATRYYVNKQGQPQHENVDVEGAVLCMRAQR